MIDITLVRFFTYFLQLSQVLRELMTKKVKQINISCILESFVAQCVLT